VVAALTSTRIYLIPQEYFWDFHSTTLAFDFPQRTDATFTVSQFHGMERQVGLQFSTLGFSENWSCQLIFGEIWEVAQYYANKIG
jgi:hypothetical protein